MTLTNPLNLIADTWQSYSRHCSITNLITSSWWPSYSSPNAGVECYKNEIVWLQKSSKCGKTWSHTLPTRKSTSTLTQTTRRLPHLQNVKTEMHRNAMPRQKTNATTTKHIYVTQFCGIQLLHRRCALWWQLKAQIIHELESPSIHAFNHGTSLKRAAMRQFWKEYSEPFLNKIAACLLCVWTMNAGAIRFQWALDLIDKTL